MKLVDEPPLAATGSALECASAVMDAALLVARLVKREIRRRRPAGLTVSQLRALAFLESDPGASLSGVADHLGLGTPTACKLAASLVHRGLVVQGIVRDDRRRSSLRLTPSGAAALRSGLRACRGALASRLARADAVERAAILRGMRLLEPLMSPTCD